MDVTQAGQHSSSIGRSTPKFKTQGNRQVQQFINENKKVRIQENKTRTRKRPRKRKTRKKQELDQESDQENKKTRKKPRTRPRK